MASAAWHMMLFTSRMMMKSVFITLVDGYSTQRINIIFKKIKKDYNLKIDYFSTHSLRKAFGRKVYQSASSDAPMTLARLQSLFGIVPQRLV